MTGSPDDPKSTFARAAHLFQGEKQAALDDMVDTLRGFVANHIMVGAMAGTMDPARFDDPEYNMHMSENDYFILKVKPYGMVHTRLCDVDDGTLVALGFPDARRDMPRLEEFARQLGVGGMKGRVTLLLYDIEDMVIEERPGPYNPHPSPLVTVPRDARRLIQH